MAIVGFEHLLTDLPSEPALALLDVASKVIKLKTTADGLSERDMLRAALFLQKGSERLGFKKVDEAIRGYLRSTNTIKDKIEFAENAVWSIRDEVYVADISDEIDILWEKIDADHGRGSYGTIKLNEEEKTLISEHISKIRLHINEMEITDRKKNALLKRLNDLQKEVDSTGTRTENFFAFLGDFSFAIGGAAKNAKPAFEEVREMMKIVYRSRSREEGISLPPGDEPLQLPPPKE